VRGVCAVKVEKSLPLDILCPLGCGLQTGAGTVLNVLQPFPGASLAVFGVGSVGIAGIMAAARFTPCTTIIAIDVVDAKLDLAKELGATHVINSKKEPDIVARIKELTKGQGLNFAFDASGNLKAIQDMIAAMANRGKCATVGGAPHGEQVQIEAASWIVRGVIYLGACQGSCIPQLFIPFLIDAWRQGRFPIDKLITRYKFTEFDKIKGDMSSGNCVKPVLLWD